jgi:GTPase Era involved in 16S rRNA processing
MHKTKVTNRIHKLLAEYGEDLFLGDEIKQLYNRILSVESSIVVVGQFSVGKSALLNAFLGEKLLATRRLESTKVITRIRYCDKGYEKIVLHGENGVLKEQPLKKTSDLGTYTTFQGSSITDELQAVDVYWPLAFLDTQLQLVDTPGANSLTETAFTVTEEELRKASAVIFLFNGQKGLDQTDYRLVTNLIERRKKVFMVASHIDGLTEIEVTTVINSVKTGLNQYVKHKQNVEIFPVSSTEALEAKRIHHQELLKNSKIEVLEQALQSYMETEGYVQAELEAITYDLEVLEASVADFAEQDRQEAAERERERQLRLERLRLLTKQEFDQVRQYGYELLDLREGQLDLVIKDFELKIGHNNRQYKEEIHRSFRNFKRKIVEESHYAAASVEIFKNVYSHHMENMNAKYSELITEFEHMVIQLHKRIKEVITYEDHQLIVNLEANKTNVKIDWPAFQQKLKNVEVIKRNVDHDEHLFSDFEADIQELDRSLLRRQWQLEKIADEKRGRASEYLNMMEELKKEQNSAIKELGEKPNPEKLTETKGLLFWKKEVIVGYDHSKEESWKRNITSIFEDYEKNKQIQIKNYQQDLNRLFIEEEKAREESDRLEAKKDEMEATLIDDLFLAIDNQKQRAQDFYKQMEREIEELWLEQKRDAEKQYIQHTAFVRRQFKRFVDEAIDIELNAIIIQ